MRGKRIVFALTSNTTSTSRMNLRIMYKRR
jgi:hypothetical protein